jgi:MFS family permease
MVVMLGGALFSIFRGWAADHVGSRPVLMTSLGIAILLPLGWLVLPRQIANPVFWCGLFYFTFGITASGTAIGAGRLLFNGVIPPEKSTSYTAIYYACLGLTGGIAPLLAGGILSISAGKAGAFGPLIVDGYSVLFVLGSVLLFFGLIQYSHVAPDGVYTTREAIRKMVASITVRRV